MISIKVTTTLQVLVEVPCKTMVDYYAAHHNGSICRGAGIPECNYFQDKVTAMGLACEKSRESFPSLYIVLKEYACDELVPAKIDENKEIVQAKERLHNTFTEAKLDLDNVQLRATAHVAKKVKK